MVVDRKTLRGKFEKQVERYACQGVCLVIRRGDIRHTTRSGKISNLVLDGLNFHVVEVLTIILLVPMFSVSIRPAKFMLTKPLAAYDFTKDKALWQMRKAEDL